MEQTKSEQEPKEAKKEIPKLNFKPVNDLLLCRIVELPEEHHGIILPENAKDHWGKQAEVIMVSDNLNNYWNEYKPGNVILFPKGLNLLAVFIEDEPYVMLHKRDVSAIVK